MVGRASVIYGIPLDPEDTSDNAMTPITDTDQAKDIEFDDQQQLVYWVQKTVSVGLKISLKDFFSFPLHSFSIYNL